MFGRLTRLHLFSHAEECLHRQRAYYTLALPSHELRVLSPIRQEKLPPLFANGRPGFPREASRAGLCAGARHGPETVRELCCLRHLSCHQGRQTDQHLLIRVNIASLVHVQGLLHVLG